MVNEKHGQPWLATVLRCTVFATVPSEQRLSLEKLTGTLPDKVNATPKVGIIEELLFSDSKVLLLRQEPGRIDLVKQAALPDDPKELVGLPVLGPFEDQCVEFRSLASNIFQSLQEQNVVVGRVAFGSEAIITVEDRKPGYQLLDKYLPFVEVDPDSSDFLYGINRLRSSNKVPDLIVNRVSRWSVKRFSAKLSADGEITFYGVQVVLDVNSAPDEKKELTGSESSGLFSEFIELTFEILDKGDCK